MKKKLLSMLMVCVLAVCLCVPAFANDHVDRPYSFVFAKNEDKTVFLAKEDASEVYVKCHEASHPYYSHVIGAPAAQGPGCATEMTARGYYTVTGTTLFMPVPYYSDYTYAVRGEKTFWDSAAWGYWSPDSVR